MTLAKPKETCFDPACYSYESESCSAGYFYGVPSLHKTIDPTIVHAIVKKKYNSYSRSLLTKTLFEK